MPVELILPTLLLAYAAIFWLFCRLERRLNKTPVDAPRELTEAEVDEAWSRIVGHWRQDPELRWPTNPGTDPFDVEREGL